jgi:hypothetical protein
VCVFCLQAKEMVSTKQQARARVLQLSGAYLSAGHVHAILKSEARNCGSKAVTKTTVWRWLKDIASDTGNFTSGPPKRSAVGNRFANRQSKTKIRASDRKRTLEHLEREGSVRGTSRDVKKLGINISPSTISRDAKKANFDKKRPNRKPRLTGALKRKRKEFAESHLDYPWPIVCFGDFKTFVLGGGHNVQNEVFWRSPGSQLPIPSQPKPKFPSTLKVFGVITSKGACDLIEVPSGKMDSEYVQKVCLQPTVPQLRRLLGSESLLWLDHDPVFDSDSSQQFLEENSDGFFACNEHPARSPDASLLESTWGDMSRVVHELNPKTQKQLRAAVFKAWTACTTQPKLDALYASMPRRMQAIVDANGGFTRY